MWMGVFFGAGNTHSWHPGDPTTPLVGPQRDNNSDPGPPGPGWYAVNSYTRCDYGADGDAMTYHTGPGLSDGSGDKSCGLHTPCHNAAYGLRAFPQQSSTAA